MTNTHDQLTFFTHLVDKVGRMQASVEGFAKLFGRVVECPTESITLRNG